MERLVCDANIIIDLKVGKTLHLIFQLPEDFAVPDVLYEQELSAQHSDLLDLGLSVLPIHEEYIQEADKLAEIYKHPGHIDLLALALAKQEGCPLLTGDSRLRNAAECEQADVRGTLWIMQRLHDEQILDVNEVEGAYQRMLEGGRWLPAKKIHAQLDSMRKAAGAAVKTLGSTC